LCFFQRSRARTGVSSHLPEDTLSCWTFSGKYIAQNKNYIMNMLPNDYQEKQKLKRNLVPCGEIYGTETSALAALLISDRRE
jgi:hypothetical protein